ncbi:MAG: tetratricopeptide repeat protein [Terriglobales bacterium]
MLVLMRLILCLVLFVTVSSAQERDPDKLLNDAIQAQQRGDYQSAITDYRQLLQLRPDHIEAKVNLGAALAHVGQFDEAIAMYRSALPSLKDKNPVLLNLGLAYYKKGDLAKAREQFATLHHSSPNNVQAAILLADAEIKLGEAEAAADMLAPLEKSFSRNSDFDYELGLALIKSGHRREGIPRMEKAGELAKGGDAYMLAGATLMDLNEFEQARHDLETALQLAPNLRGLHKLVGMARDKTGDQKAAEPAFRQALKENPDDFDANLYLGALLYKQRHMEEAKVYLEHAVQLKPTDSMARYESAMLKSTSGEYEAAARELEGVVKENPDWLEPHVELTSLYYKLHRPSDGAKERAIVDRLTAEQQAKGPGK